MSDKAPIESQALAARQRLRRWLGLLMPVPHSGHWGADFFYLTLIAALEHSLVRFLAPSVLTIDLLTPWLVVSVVQKRAPAAILLALYAGVINEAASSVPAGTYACCYLILTAVIVQIRPTLSWRFATTWLVTFAVASLAPEIFRISLVLLLAGADGIRWVDSVGILVHVASAVVIGMWLCRRWLHIQAEEPIPL